MEAEAPHPRGKPFDETRSFDDKTNLNHQVFLINVCARLI